MDTTIAKTAPAETWPTAPATITCGRREADTLNTLFAWLRDTRSEETRIIRAMLEDETGHTTDWAGLAARYERAATLCPEE